MDLSNRCSHEFSHSDWRRGGDYFRSGAVHIAEQVGDRLAAEVQGSARRPYVVLLDWSEVVYDTLRVHCTCPRFAEVCLCKHVAAVIQAADDQGLGKLVPGTRQLVLDAINEIDLEIFDESALDEEHGYETSWRDEALPVYKFGTVAKKGRRGRSSGSIAPNWKTRLSQLHGLLEDRRIDANVRVRRAWKRPRQVWYLLDVRSTFQRGWPCISLWQREQRKNGTFGAIKAASFTLEEVEELASQEDRELIELLVGNEKVSDYGYAYNYTPYEKLKTFAVSPAMFEIVLPKLCRTQRFGWALSDRPSGPADVALLAWDEGPPWQLKIDVTKTADNKNWSIVGNLVRGEQSVDLQQPIVLLECKLVIFPDRIARYDHGGAFPWILTLRNAGPLVVPVKQEADFIEWMAQQPDLPPIGLPEELQWKQERPEPRPCLTIAKPKNQWQVDLECRLTFQYGHRVATFGSGAAAWVDKQNRLAVCRNLAAETAARDRLLAAGARRNSYDPSHPEVHLLTPTKMPRLVADLAAAGWQVEAEGRLIRSPGKLSFSVTSGVDWFDLEGTCDFGGAAVSLPELLAALRRGEKLIRLDDGSQGMLPVEWLARYGQLAELGQTKEGRLRFLPAQAALLDALLAAQESQRVKVDGTFARWREKVKSFTGIAPRDEPSSFQGQLRPYQREGLGWLHFLDEFGFGGCLADDMGLGKTVQVLAMLEERYRHDGSSSSGKAPASLAVVPRSLVFNWLEEARRFTPQLRVLDYTGVERGGATDRFHEYDLVVTTYGTLRRDIAALNKIEFDYAILDEAQAIKNASSQSAKACRLICARRRLAMTGTPIENHLGELWSIFEFLNPGMLGKNPKLHRSFATMSENGAGGKAKHGTLPEADLTILSQALRPFMLRRTKGQVLSELPAKVEQTLFCELDPQDRKRYDEIRDYYRDSLLKRIQKQGVNRAKMHVLEALLRLRQAACHPGLLDAKQANKASSKLESLLDQLSEVVDEGHKALVFSQFTSFLAIVRRHLDQRKIVYEYLDGKTTNRQAKVERFQSDAACPLFLISLKAGGHGLNLTAADYVFILDPWWNPAVEAQAVDRAHRIGQQRPVFAYRLIARNTVEEKILELQKQKRDLAEAIVSADSGPLQSLTAEDLQLLLS